MAETTTRRPPHRLLWPLSPSQVEHIDRMFEDLYRQGGRTGATGAVGATGATGATGAAGANGAPGPPGADGTAADVMAVGYWAPVTNGDPGAPELIFDSFGDIVVAWVGTP